MSSLPKPNARTAQKSHTKDSASVANTSAAEEKSPLSSPEPPVYTRRAPGGFGDRLALARGLPPQEAPPAPALRATASTFSMDGGVSLLPSVSVARSGVFLKIKGSYISPYDVGGRTPGNQRLPASSTTVEEFEAKYGASAIRFPPSSADVQETASEGSVESDRTVGPSKVIAPPANAQYRTVLLGPFRLMRSACVRDKDSNPGCAALLEWLDDNMPGALQHPAARDSLMPGIIYTVTVPMTDEDWASYIKVLSFFPLAQELQDLLAAGEDSLDQVTDVLVNSNGESTRALLEDQLELDEMVRKNRLGIPWDWGRRYLRPEVFPDAYPGGYLKGYKG